MSDICQSVHKSNDVMRDNIADMMDDVYSKPVVYTNMDVLELHRMVDKFDKVRMNFIIGLWRDDTWK